MSFRESAPSAERRHPEGKYLGWARLSGAYLSGANLSKFKRLMADQIEADLCGARFKSDKRITFGQEINK